MFNKSYNVAAAERVNKALANSYVKYTVRMLDESVETFSLSTETLGMNLLDSVCDCLELLERDYFGIQYRCDDSHSTNQIWKWIKMDKLMRKQVNGDLTSKTFYLRIRFVPVDVLQMQETYTRYQLFLQTKQDIYNNRINCPKDIAVQLAGCVLQSELGDYNKDNIKPGYVGEFRFIHDQTPTFETEVANFHKTLRNQSADEAEIKFLTIAKKLSQHGCDLYSCEFMNRPTQFGFHAMGISIFPPDPKDAFIIPWNSLDKVLNKSKTFLITVLMTQSIFALVEGGAQHSSQVGSKPNQTILHDKLKSGFKLVFPTTNEAKEAWQSCIESHSFFRVRDPKQIQSNSSVKRSHSFFRLTRVPSLFSGRRTLPELIDIRRRNRTLERSFIRTPSKRFAKKYPIPAEKQSIISGDSGRPSSSAHGKPKKHLIVSGNSNIKDKSKAGTKKEDDKSDSENSVISEHDESDIEAVSLRPTSLTQSVRLDKTSSQNEFTNRQITQSMPRRPKYKPGKLSATEDDKKDLNNAAPKSTVKSDTTPKSLTSPRPSITVNEVKSHGVTKSQSQLKSKLSGSVSSLKNTLSNSNGAMYQSTDRLVDLESCVEVTLKPEDSKYGFTIRGGFDTGNHVIVTKVIAGSAADIAVPNLFEGDQIIKINDLFADDLTNDEIKEIIRTTGHKKDNLLVLTVKPRLYIPDDTITPDGLSADEEDGSFSASKIVAKDLRTEITLLEESLKNGSAVAQFEKLYKQKQGLSMTEAKKTDNVNKNRYKDILPYDQTRILVRNTDYINANLIKFDVPKSAGVYKYIAAQGPLTNTSNDFLTMVWENKTQLIVMLTDLQEKGRSKCFKYWPSSGETTKLPQGIQLTCESETILSTFAIRDLKIKKGNETRKFTHLQYLSWPDHDVPQKMEDFINFMKTMRQLRTSKSEPIIVHCSAGIGRTGVVITMDIAISHIEAKLPFSVLSIVKEIRNQRAMLIQSQKQYDFVCRAIINYFSNNSK